MKMASISALSSPILFPIRPALTETLQGALKREVAEFRLYGYDATGKVVCELAMDADTMIEWTVELANLKAAWYPGLIQSFSQGSVPVVALPLPAAP
jgi:hypothetical protein